MAGWYARQLAGAGGGSGSGSGSGGAGGRSGSGSGSGGSGKTYAPPTTAEIDAFARRYAHAVNNKLSEESDYGYAMITDFENRFGVDNDLWPRIKQWALDRGYIRGYKNAH
jgi:hypothetical protein